MPITPGTSTPLILVNLVATGNIGQGTPKVAAGIANGLSQWIASVQASATAAGTLGVGFGILPLIIPPPVFVAALFPAFASFNLLGIMSPLFITGLANGLSQACALGIIQTTHPTVGIGAGVVRFVAPPAGPVFVQAFESLKMNGEGAKKLANAIGMALDTVFRALTYPIPVAGSPNIVPGAGPGTGKII